MVNSKRQNNKNNSLFRIALLKIKQNKKYGQQIQWKRPFDLIYGKKLTELNAVKHS